MKRDWDVIRRILIEVEGSEGSWRATTAEDAEHSRLLIEEGLVDGFVVQSEASFAPSAVLVHRLRMGGHDLLESIRDDSVFRETMSRAASLAGGLTLSMVKELAVSIIRQKLGMG